MSELGTYMQRHVAPQSWAPEANCNADLAEASLVKLILSNAEGARQCLAPGTVSGWLNWPTQPRPCGVAARSGTGQCGLPWEVELWTLKAETTPARQKAWVTVQVSQLAPVSESAPGHGRGATDRAFQTWKSNVVLPLVAEETRPRARDCGKERSMRVSNRAPAYREVGIGTLEAQPSSDRDYSLVCPAPTCTHLQPKLCVCWAVVVGSPAIPSLVSQVKAG